MKFTNLENAGLSRMIEACPEARPTLEMQGANAEVVKRENTGVGFFTTLKVKKDAPLMTQSKSDVAHAFAEVSGIENGMGIILFQANGLIDQIEFWTVTPARTDKLDPYDLEFEIKSVESAA
ncbi:MAG: hypothetical protein ABGW84_08485 [Sphingomonadaceae bacterium]